MEGIVNKYRGKSSRARVWETIRAMQLVTVPEICMITGAKPNNVMRYMRALELAGYVRKQRTKAEGIWLQYRMVKNTGPKAPVQKLIRQVWDPNTGELWQENQSGMEATA